MIGVLVLFAFLLLGAKACAFIIRDGRRQAADHLADPFGGHRRRRTDDDLSELSSLPASATSWTELDDHQLHRYISDLSAP